MKHHTQKAITTTTEIYLTVYWRLVSNITVTATEHESAEERPQRR